MRESIRINAPPHRVWEVVSDVRRMGAWSPECRKLILWGRPDGRESGSARG